MLVHLFACLLSKTQETKGKWECGRDGKGSGISWERGKHDQNILSDFLKQNIFVHVYFVFKGTCQ